MPLEPEVTVSRFESALSQHDMSPSVLSAATPSSEGVVIVGAVGSGAVRMVGGS